MSCVSAVAASNALGRSNRMKRMVRPMNGRPRTLSAHMCQLKQPQAQAGKQALKLKGPHCIVHSAALKLEPLAPGNHTSVDSNFCLRGSYRTRPSGAHTSV